MEVWSRRATKTRLFSHKRVTRCFYTTFHEGRVPEEHVVFTRSATGTKDQPRDTLILYRAQGGRYIQKTRILDVTGMGVCNEISIDEEGRKEVCTGHGVRQAYQVAT